MVLCYPIDKRRYNLSIEDIVTAKSIYCEECDYELIGYIFEYNDKLFCCTDCIYQNIKNDISEKYVRKESK